MPKAVVITIGINYKGQSSELQGCVNDATNMMKYMRERFGGDLQYRKKLVDDLPKSHSRYPSKKNICDELKKAVTLCKTRGFTHFILHYSGHGTQIADQDGDESDGLDEAIVPADFERNGIIRDDWLLREVVNELPESTEFFALIDACHSESMLDLRFAIRADGSAFQINTKSSMVPRAMMISGCRDDRVSYDAMDGKYKKSGAMTVAFLNAMEGGGHKRPVLETLVRMRKELEGKGYPQIPQLSATRRIDINQRIYGLGNT